MKTLWQELKFDFVFWYCIVSPMVNLVLTVISYNDPTFGFTEFGPSIYLTTIFPALWLVIYVYCKNIVLKRKNAAELQGKTPPQEGKKEDSQGGVNNA